MAMIALGIARVLYIFCHFGMKIENKIPIIIMYDLRPLFTLASSVLWGVLKCLFSVFSDFYILQTFIIISSH
jgi:hypothetical protein